MEVIHFRQSCNDFPLTVKLGEKAPSWGISRWDGNGGLRLIPPDDEGFTVRGDKRLLVYKGRRRSHRFTILGDTAFEYDCILEREPESNVISLVMEGAENFDFYRQPEFVNEPFLKGSFAVYKKETLLGEGTGKLCHIHRPQIIDAWGRWCWGDLSVTGNQLCITIPENWLSEALYPVVVDPTVGTTTVGSQTQWKTVESNGVEEYCLLGTLAVNKFLLPEDINGTVTAYVYAYDKLTPRVCMPVLYSDTNDVPMAKLSTNEGSFDVTVSGLNPAGWRSTTFGTYASIQSGNYVWYGLSAGLFYPRFDYGAKLYWFTYGNYLANLPDTFPLFPDNRCYDYKVSMYFTYTAAQNYVRTITQGVSLTDSRKLIGNYKRSAIEIAKINFTLSRLKTFYRTCFETITNTMIINRVPAYFRNVTEYTKAGMSIQEMLSFSRKCADDVTAIPKINGFLTVIREIFDELIGFDSQSFSVVFVRSARDDVSVFDSSSHWGAFVRSLLVHGGSIAKTTHGAEYHRRETDMVQAEGKANRGLLLFVRIITQVFIRDYLLGRFLKARQELVLKSCICRELPLESRID